MNKAVLLDRDGVVNVERGTYTYKKEDFSLTTGLITSLKKLVENNFLLFIITNQGGIAKGLYSHQDFINLDNHLKTKLKEEGISIADTFYCPHHNDYGRCICRKPDSLLIEKAMAKYNLDVGRMVFIGDKQRDVDAGEKVGVKSYLIESNSGITHIINEILAC